VRSRKNFFLIIQVDNVAPLTVTGPPGNQISRVRYNPGGGGAAALDLLFNVFVIMFRYPDLFLWCIYRTNKNKQNFIDF
jgi:hypothetical protein